MKKDASTIGGSLFNASQDAITAMERQMDSLVTKSLTMVSRGDRLNTIIKAGQIAQAILNLHEAQDTARNLIN